MSHEFYYTSAPRGLVKGTRGYCAVAMTKGLPPFLGERLEDYSGYKPLFGALDERNPVNIAHYRIDLGAQTYHILTRVAASGLDYTERTNKFAHHVVLTANELPAAGPAWLAQQPGFLETEWDGGEPRWLPAGRPAPQGRAGPKVCSAWTRAAGDPGWAGVLAECALAVPMRPVVVLYEPGTDVLALFAEAMALLPEKLRWRVTFATYASSLPPGESSVWRGLAIGSPEASPGPHLHGAKVITLSPNMEPAEGGPLVAAARTGKVQRLESGGAEDEPSSGNWPRRPAREAGDALDDPNLAMGQISLESLQATEDQPALPMPMAPARAPLLTAAPWKMQTLCIGLGTLLGLALLFVGELLSDRSFADMFRPESGSASNQSSKKDKETIEALQNDKKELQDELKVLKSGSTDEKTSLIVALRGQITARLGEVSQLNETLKSRDAELKLATLQAEGLAKELRKANEATHKLEGQIAKLDASIKKLEETKKKGSPKPPVALGKVEPWPLLLTHPVVSPNEPVLLDGVAKESEVFLFLRAKNDKLQWLTKDGGTKIAFQYKAGAELHTFFEMYVHATDNDWHLVGKFTEHVKNYGASLPMQKAIEAIDDDVILLVRVNGVEGGLGRLFRPRFKIEVKKR